jgi:hypothetical protein
MSKREEEYRMNKIKENINNIGYGGLHQGKGYDLAKIRKNSIYGSVGSQRIQDMYPESIIKKEYMYKYEEQKEKEEENE